MIESADEVSAKLSRACTRRFGIFEVNLQARELRKHGIRVKLSGQPFEILGLLLEQPGEIVTREQLRAHLWPAETFVDFEHSLNTAVKKLRATLGDFPDNCRYIETIPRFGYRFIAPVELIPADVSGVGQATTPGSGDASRALRLDVTTVGRPGYRFIAPTEHANGTTPLVQSSVRQDSTWPEVADPRRILFFAAALGILAVCISAGYIYWQRYSRPSSASSRRIMLAVMPFDNLTGDSEQDFLSDGLTEEMITQLGSLRSERLGVIARSSVMGFKHGDRRLEEIGRQLGVQYVLEGSVRRSSGRVRITAQLIQVKDQSHLWAASYDRGVQDLLALEGEVAAVIAKEVQLELPPQQPTSPGSASPNPETHEAYLKGQYFLSKRTTESLGKAIESFRQVLQKDPNYAPAHAALASSYVVIGSGESFPGDTFEKARLAAKKALELDGSLAEAHAALALIAQNHDWNFEESEKEFKRAIALNPSYATARHWFSFGLAATGRFDEADAQMKQARELDPLSLIISSGAGLVLYLERHPEKAVEQFNKTLDLEPNFAQAHEGRGLAYAELGKLKEAAADFEAAKRLDNDPRTVALFGNAFARLGQREEARRLLAELNDRSKHEYVNPWCQAIVYAGLGEKDLAFQWLEKAFQERATDLIELKVAQFYDGLRTDPRFMDLLRRVGLLQ